MNLVKQLPEYHNRKQQLIFQYELQQPSGTLRCQLLSLAVRTLNKDCELIKITMWIFFNLLFSLSDVYK